MLVISDSVKDMIKDGAVTFSRRHALGYKNLVFTNADTGNDVVVTETEDSLVYTGKATEEANFNDEFVFVTKEFGVFGYKDKFFSDIEVIFADDGVMVVTLIKGAICVNLNGNPMVVTRGIDDSALPRYSVEDILWRNQADMMPYLQSTGAKFCERYPFDYKYLFTLSGNDGGMMNFRIRRTADAIDISLGRFAVIEQEEENRMKAKEAKKLMSQFVDSASSSSYSDIDGEIDMGDDIDIDPDDYID